MSDDLTLSEELLAASTYENDPGLDALRPLLMQAHSRIAALDNEWWKDAAGTNRKPATKKFPIPRRRNECLP